MSYWSHNPELYTEIIFNQMVEEGLADPDTDDPSDTVSDFLDKPDSWELAIRAERNYWSDIADWAEQRGEK